jgi:hypothetical protein
MLFRLDSVKVCNNRSEPKCGLFESLLLCRAETADSHIRGV